MHPSTRGLFAAIPLALALLLAGGCASRKSIDTSTPEGIIQAVNRGDTVRVTTKNGTEHEFVVDRITNKALYGQSKRVVYEDVQALQIRRAGKTVRSTATAKSESEPGFFERMWDKVF